MGKSQQLATRGFMAARKNLIINGNFDIWQRGTSFTSSGYGADRYNIFETTSTMTFTRQGFTTGQTDVPGEPRYYARQVVTTGGGAGSETGFYQPIEDIRTTAGKTITLSFYGKADAAKDVAVEWFQTFGTGGSPSSNVAGHDVTTLNFTTSWQKFIITTALPSIAGETIGTDENSWAAAVFWTDGGADSNSRNNSLGNQSGTFEFANIQIEYGSEATDFEYRSIGEELTLCQRYFEKSYAIDVDPGTVDDAGRTYIYINGVASAVAVGTGVEFASRKRTAPTLTFYSPTNGTAAKARDYIGVINVNIGGSTGTETNLRFWVNTTTSTAITVGAQWTADAEL